MQAQNFSWAAIAGGRHFPLGLKYRKYGGGSIRLDATTSSAPIFATAYCGTASKRSICRINSALEGQSAQR
jgi:hypothetical protein